MDDDNSKKFTAGPSITIQIPYTEEMASFINSWSAMVPTLYILDICAAAATKLSSKQLKKNPQKAILVDQLHSLDYEYNGISYICALMEKVSDSRGRLSCDELKAQILDDMSALRNFFKKAHVIEPDDFLIEFLKTLMGEPIESKKIECLDFLRKLNDHFKLQNSVSPKQRLKKAEEIILEARSLNIYVQHPIVTIALACLYGNQYAKKLMKFKTDPNKFDVENVLADIFLISRFARLKLQSEDAGRNIPNYKFKRANFITDDNSLSALLKFFDPKVFTYWDDGKTDEIHSELSMTVNLKDLLTDVTDVEYEVIFNLLGLK